MKTHIKETAPVAVKRARRSKKPTPQVLQPAETEQPQTQSEEESSSNNRNPENAENDVNNSNNPANNNDTNEEEEEETSRIVISPLTTTIADLCQMKTSKRRKGKRKSPDGANDNAEEETTTNNTQQPASSSSSTANNPNPPLASRASYRGPRVRIVDGQIRIDQQSMETAEDSNITASGMDISSLEQVEESHEARHITSASFSKRQQAVKWTQVDTDMFYKGLQQWGTDFELISQMFPGRSRRHIKLKYNKEEKANPERIDAALSHRIKPTALPTATAAASSSSLQENNEDDEVIQSSIASTIRISSSMPTASSQQPVVEEEEEEDHEEDEIDNGMAGDTNELSVVEEEGEIIPMDDVDEDLLFDTLN